MQYRRTPLAEGYSPSELLNGRQIRTRIDALLPSPAHMAQSRQAKAAAQSQAKETPELVAPTCTVDTPCYGLYCGPRQERDPRWDLLVETAAANPVSDTSALSSNITVPFTTMDISGPSQEFVQSKRPNPHWPTGDQYGPDNPRRSARRKPHGQ